MGSHGEEPACNPVKGQERIKETGWGEDAGVWYVLCEWTRGHGVLRTTCTESDKWFMSGDLLCTILHYAFVMNWRQGG